MGADVTRPLVSIAMPVRNCASTVGAAVRSLIGQSLRDWELLLIDDGSTDGTLAEVQRFEDSRVRILHDGRSKGLPVRLNEAIDLAAGEFIARMDGDDVSYPERLEIQHDYLKSHPNVDLVGGGVLVFGDRGQAIGTRLAAQDHDEIVRRPHSGFALAHPTFFGRSRWFRTWRFNPASGGACDQDLLLRAHAESRFANVPAIVLGYRESSVVLPKIIGYRLKFARSLAAHYRVRNLYRLSMGLSLIAAKVAVDVVAVSTGSSRRLLRHRAKPAAASDLAAWSDVWRQAGEAR